MTNAFDELESEKFSKVAVLDIGSNSFHLVVARIVAGSVQIIHKAKQKVRLADGLSDDYLLSQDAIQRGIDTLQVFKASLAGFEPESVRIVATYTLRKAKNAWQFIDAAKDVFPYPVEVVSGQEEARLIFNGVAHTAQLSQTSLIIDIGGGSTELALGKEFTPQILRSLDMGCVSFNKQFFKHGDVKKKNFDRAITTAQQRLELVEEKYLNIGWKNCIGTSGTIESIYQLCAKGQLGYQLNLKDLLALKEKLIELKTPDNFKFDEVSEDRRPILAAGLAILIGVFKSLHIKGMSFNSAALREGAIYEMEASLSHGDIRERSAQSLATRYSVDIEHAQRVLTTCFDLYKHSKTDWKLHDKKHKAIIGWAALLHEVGLQINSKGVQKHSCYILRNTELPGFNSEQQEFLALLNLMQRKKVRIEALPRFGQYSQLEFLKCMIILRLAVLLNVKRQNDFVPELNFEVNGFDIALSFPAQWLNDHPIIKADLEREKKRYQTFGFHLTLS
ncbi:MAG: exopolyphosphatase [Gammaproteobacteria bacterium]|nr:exopolyphosphatase [Gammaproteobacteria bacterium]